MQVKKKENRGGKRAASGRKKNYNEKTKTVAFRCPLSKVDELKIIVKSKFSEWSVKQLLTRRYTNICQTNMPTISINYTLINKNYNTKKYENIGVFKK